MRLNLLCVAAVAGWEEQHSSEVSIPERRPGVFPWTLQLRHYQSRSAASGMGTGSCGILGLSSYLWILGNDRAGEQSSVRL